MDLGQSVRAGLREKGLRFEKGRVWTQREENQSVISLAVDNVLSILIARPLLCLKSSSRPFSSLSLPTSQPCILEAGYSYSRENC